MAQNTTGVDDVVRGAGAVIERKEAEDPGSSSFWQQELQASYDRERHWLRNVKVTIELYRDDRAKAKASVGGTASTRAIMPYRLNILWSNTEILKASLYGESPAPDIRRRWRDDDKVARNAAEMLERAVSYQMDTYDYDGESKAAVEDFVLPGRGVLRVNYEPMFNDEQDTIIRQDFTHSYVFWDDYRESAGRRDKDKWWKAFRHRMSRDELKELLKKPGANSKANADDIPLGVQTVSQQGDKPKSTRDTFQRAEVWEIWDAKKKQRTWIACDYDPILLEEDDPYQLKDFFPVPRPIVYVSTNDRSEPVVPYSEYADQALELDRITTRLNRLTEALKYRGIHDASGGGDKDAVMNLGDLKDNEFVPHKNMAQALQHGGLDKLFVTMPIDELIKVVNALYERRAALVQDIMEITGISDIVRASTDPRETLGAQELKANFSSLRTRDPQEEVNRQQRDIIRLLSELMAEHIQPDILMEVSGTRLPTREQQQAAQQAAIAIQRQNAAIQANPQLAQQIGAQPQPVPDVPDVTIDDVIEMLRSDRTRSFRIGIETSVTGMQDQAQDRKNRIELVTTLKDMLAEAIPAMEANPTIRPLLKEMVLFTVRGFEQGRQLEDTLEDVFDQIEQQPPPQPPPDPAAEILKADVQRKAQKDQADTQTDQAKLALQKQKQDSDAALKDRQLDITEQDNLADQEIELTKVIAEAAMPEGEFIQ